MDYIIRKADCKDLRQIAYVHVDSWRETYPGIIDSEILHKLSYGKAQENWKFCLERSTQLFYVAEIAGAIAGFAVGGALRDEELIYDAEIYAMYVLKDFQKCGIGKALLLTLAAEFSKENWQNFLIWSLSKNNACGFYEKMGGIHQESKKIRIGSQQHIEYGFIFQIDTLLQSFAANMD